MPDPEEELRVIEPLAAGAPLGRYQLLERLGEGGMGVVYLARDPELDRKVAIKIIRAEALPGSDGAQLRERLAREARTMARLDHPNVVAVRDIGTAAGQLFLAMDYVEGGTLREWLARAPRTREEILRVFQLAADGLAAAHAAGIVHRDFKPDNVLVGSDGRVRVTDFGLALPITLTEPTPPSAAPHELPPTHSGTPAYSAPEQMRGEPVDARADVFSFSVSLYEALYGLRPYDAPTSSELLAQITQRRLQPAPREVQVPSRLRRALRRGMAPEPAQRFASMQALTEALDGRRARRRAGLIGVAALGVVLLAAGLLARSQRFGAPGMAASRRGVAVLPPRDLSPGPDSAWLSSALTELLAGELGRGGTLRVAQSENVAHLLRDLGLAGAQTLTPPELEKLRLGLAAEAVVSGSYRLVQRGAQPSLLRLELLLWNAATGQRTASISEEGSPERLRELLALVGARLRSALLVAAPRLDEPGAQFPADAEAARAYAEGLAQLRSFELAAARNSLSRAAALAPDNAEVQAALARALAALGFDKLAQEAAHRAVGLAGALGREQGLVIEGLDRELQKDWPHAIEIDRALTTIFPDNLDYGLRLADAQLSAGRAQDALATVAALRKLPPPAGDDPRLDLCEARADQTLVLPAAALAAAEQAAVKAEARGARLVLAEAKRYQGNALRRLGQRERAQAALEQAAAAFHQVGDNVHEAQAINSLGNIRVGQSDLAGARAEYEKTLAIYQQLGNVSGQGTAANNIATILDLERDLAGSHRWYERALAAYRELGAQADLALALFNLGQVCEEQGDLECAQSHLEQSLSLRRELGDKHGQSTALEEEAVVALLGGDLSRARALIDQTLRLAAETGEASAISTARYRNGRVLLAEGKTREAEVLLAQALLEFRKVTASDQIAFVVSLCAQARLLLGRPDEAQRSFEALPPASALTPSGLQTVKLGRAFIDGMTGARTDAAEDDLRAIAADSEQRGFVTDLFEARFALGKVQLHRGELRAGRATLRALARDAAARGFGLYQRRAAALLR